MTCTADGFSAWGKDIGGYSSNPEVAAENEAIYHHETGGMAEDGTTVDFQTVGDDKTPADNAVTIRDRDTMEQVRVPISELKSWLEEKLTY